MKKAATLALSALPACSGKASADDAPVFIPQWLGAQYTFVDQNQSPVHSPYSGPLSLNPKGSTARSHTFGAYSACSCQRDCSSIWTWRCSRAKA